MEKITIKGIKKLFGLTKTKIRLAKEADTKYTKPKPLPLIKLLSGQEIETVEQAEEYLNQLKDKIDYTDDNCAAKTVFELMDIIEGVKYKFEPLEFMVNVDEKKLSEIESKARDNSLPVNLLLMTKTAQEGLNLFVGENPCKNTIFMSRVPTTLAYFINFAFNSEYFSHEQKLKNVNIVLGHRTLILNAVSFALGKFGGNLIDETIDET